MPLLFVVLISSIKLFMMSKCSVHIIHFIEVHSSTKYLISKECISELQYPGTQSNGVVSGE